MATDPGVVPAISEDSTDVNFGLRWIGVANIAARLIALARVVALARIAGPHEFGVFTGVFAFAAGASVVAELGLRPYMIHRAEHARSEARAVRRLAVTTSGAAAVVLAACAPLMTALYSERSAAAVTLALAAWVWIGGFSVVPMALLRSERRFRDAALLQLVADVVGTAVALIAALMGQRVWALVAAVTATQLILSVGSVVLVRDLLSPRLPTRDQRIIRRHALRYGSAVTLGALVWAVALHGDNVTVGKIAGATALGFYAFAYNYGIVPGTFVGGTVSEVALVAFSRASSDEERRELFVRFATVGSAASSPIVAVAIAFASSAVSVALGSFWLPAVGALQVMFLVGWLRGLLPTESLLRSEGRVAIEPRVGFIAAPLTILAAAVGAQSGPTLTATLVGLVLSATGLVVVKIAVKGIRLPLSRLCLAILPTMGLASFVASVAFALARILDTSDVVNVVAFAPVALTGYFLLLRRLCPSQFAQLASIVRPSWSSVAPESQSQAADRTLVVLAHFGWEVPFMQFHKRLSQQFSAHGFHVLWVDDRVRLKDGFRTWLRAIPSGVIDEESGLSRLQPWTVPGERFGERFPLPQWLVSRSVRRILNVRGKSCDLLLAYTPMENPTVRFLSPTHVVYWTGDEVTMANDDWLLRRADIVLAVSERAATESARVAAGRVHRVSTGVDIERFRREPRALAEVEGLSRPILGYVGALSANRVDVELIRGAAVENSEGTVLLIGEEHGSFLDDAQLPPNVVRLGPRPFDDVPQYVHSFDVGLVPYLLNAFNLGSDPLKVHEYLAAGVPVVATDLPALRAYRGLVSIVGSADDFGREALRVASERNDEERIAERKRAAEAFGIDRVADRIVEIFDGVMNVEVRP